MCMGEDIMDYWMSNPLKHSIRNDLRDFTTDRILNYVVKK